MTIDPHTHSTASDGTTTPANLMGEAANSGIGTIGLTDHDTVAGWEEAAAQVGASGVSLIRGMEVSAAYAGISVHIVAYLFNPADPVLQAHMSRVQASRSDRAQEIVERLHKDTGIVWSDVVEETHEGATIGRPHIADALVTRGVVGSRGEAFDRFLNPRTPYFVRHYAPEAATAVEWIQGGGGKAVLAHPCAPLRSKVIPERAFGELAEAGLFGLEVDHRDNDVTKISMLEDALGTFGLARFGSSDYHGSGKPNRLGENTTSPAVLSALIDGCYLEVLNP